MRQSVCSWRGYGRSFGAAVLACLILVAGLLGAEPSKPKDAKDRPTNRLAKEISPYLLMHAHNPVDWYPWGPEAFTRARKEKKLILLSIGYSSCYWCHVMERETFSNKEVAKILNKDFVCIKVDREERPDIDAIYMRAYNVMSDGGGGWPLNLFLTADGKPIIALTYRHPDDQEIDKQKVLGFNGVLKLIKKVHDEKPKDIAKQADMVADLTVKALARSTIGLALVDLDRKLVADALDSIEEEFDKAHGGFGSAERKFRGPKFPSPPVLSLLLHEAGRTKAADLTKMVTVTLDHMAYGGIYDQLGGGFHRYSTERTWTVPHFEKMLYDNAQLAEVYARAYRLTKKPLYKRIAEDTLRFMKRELNAPGGGFYSALDAETKGEEGRFYVWTGKELDAALKGKKDAALIKKVYGADGAVNFERKYYILTLPKPLAETARDLKLTEAQLEAKLAPLRKKLYEVRSKRTQPFLDTKILTAWNGQAIAAFATAGKILEEPRHIQTAARAANFILKELRNRKGRLLRTYAAQPGKKPEARLNGYLDDYAFLVQGLLCLHDATGEKKWLAEARALTDTMIQFHTDRYQVGFFHKTRERGGYFYTSNDHEKLFARAKDQFDGAQPSGNSIAVQNLARLWARTGEDRYQLLVRQNLKAFAGSLKNNPTALTAMLEGLAIYLDAKEARKGKGASK
jgi:uncharacterized protein YyaL (SSP411 family)